MKKLTTLFTTLYILLVFTIPAWAAFDLQAGVEGVLDDLFNGLIRILGIAIAGLVTFYVHRLTKKLKLDEYNGIIDSAIERGVLYAEERARQIAKDNGYAVTGAQKFASAYGKVDQTLKKVGITYLSEDEVKEMITAKLSDLRLKGLDKLEQEVRDRLPKEE